MAQECKTCKGSGNVKCPKCDGKGRIYGFLSSEECKHCEGSGIKKCGVCRGTGKV
ncbi:MAG: hypothetical protein KIS66_00765 [Fimbriimonadaceae bacterium]|nr:hypothetical protein [Fimbriimonadaceae bacterium]